MNEATLSELRMLVDRAVRPVRASRSGKRKMREELLAHLVAVLEEEAARVDEERGALERTTQRFGDPAELTGQLQGSVPRSDLGQRFVEYLSTVRLMTWLRAALAIFGIGICFWGGGYQAVLAAVVYYLTADAVLDFLFPMTPDKSQLLAGG